LRSADAARILLVVNDQARCDEPPARLRDWLTTQLPAPLDVQAMEGGAGARRYWRVRDAEGHTAVCMEARPEDPAILPPALRTPRGIPFVAMTQWLGERGFPAPRLRAVAEAERWVLVEDLGSQHLRDLSPSARAPHYRRAVELLGKLHALAVCPDCDELPHTRRFDHEWVLFELRLFLELVNDPRLRQDLDTALGHLASHVEALPAAVCLRDYQSHNLMIDGRGQLRIIDYQDALLAPPELDLAALLHDSYVDFPVGEREALLHHYERTRGERVVPQALAALIVQRKCKDLSRYIRLVRQGDERYRGPDVRAIRSIREALPDLPSSLQAEGKLIGEAVDRISS
jgi:aminoglycoside/choline kinase family phosphotransferase